MTQRRNPTAAIKTQGCKLNQFESQQIREQLARLGCDIVPFEGPADIYVINSCTVTARTDRDCRRLIRHAKKLNPAGFVAVTGCYAEVAPETLEAIPQADLVADNATKARIGHEIRERLADSLAWPAEGGVASTVAYSCDGDMLERFAGHTRAFVKVQEGCNAFCSYCIIPHARGRSRSAEFDDVVAQTRRLIRAGHPEIVLIGTHLGQYGLDLENAPNLAGVVETLCELPGLGRLRLSSIEPREVSEELLQFVAHHPKVCRHLHLPLQNGCDSVLERMNRPYTAQFYGELAHRIREMDPGICVGADVIVGFPGETDEEFETCREFIESIPLSYLHVFTYSSRPGTPAAEMPDQVLHEVKIARNHRLRDLSEVIRARFAEAMVGEALETVLERTVTDEPGVLDGLTDNYLRVTAPGPESLLGTIQALRITQAHGEGLRGALQ